MPDWLKEALVGAAVSVAITIGLVLYEKHAQAAAAWRP